MKKLFVRHAARLSARAALAAAVTGVSAFTLQTLRADSTAINQNALPLDNPNAWSNGLPGPADIAIFDPSWTNPGNLTLGDNQQSWLGLTINTSGAVTINPGYTLTLGAGGITDNNYTYSLTLNNSLLLSASQTWQTNGGSIAVGGPVDFGAGTLALSGYGLTTFTNTLTDGSLMLVDGASASIAGNDSLSQIVQSGSGSLTLAGTGNVDSVSILSGVLNIASATALGSGRLVLSGGTFDNTSGAPLSLNAPVTIGGSIAFQGTNNLTLPGTVTIAGGNYNLNLNAGTLNLSGVINNDGGTRFLSTYGPGVLQLSATSSIISGLGIMNGTVVLTGSLTSSAGEYIGSTNGQAGVLVINGGTLSANSLPGLQIGTSFGGVGVLRLNGGSVSSAGEIWVAPGPSVPDLGASSYGALIVNAGTLVSTSYLAVARGAAINSAGLGVFDQTGGVVIVSSNQLTVGAFQGTAGGLHAVSTISGGTLTLLGGSIFAGENVDANVTISGSAIASASSTTIAVNPGVTGRLNLLGGTLTTSLASGSGSAILNFNGGVLRALSATLSTASLLRTDYVWGNNAIIDDNGFTTTFNDALQPATGSGMGTLTAFGGGGYVAEPLVAISGGGGQGATAVALVSTSSGQVTGIQITNPGVGYTSVPTIQFLGGGGGGAAVNTLLLAANASTGGLIKAGQGSLILTAQSTYVGPTTIRSGALVLSFNTNATLSSNVISPLSPAALSGSALVLQSSQPAGRAQSLPSLTLNPGTVADNLTLSYTGTNNTPGLGITLNLGVLTRTGFGSVLNFNDTTANFAANTFTTLSTNMDFTGAGGQKSILGGWAVYNGSASSVQSWASSAGNGTSSGAVTPLASFDSSFDAGQDVGATGGASTTASGLVVNSLRFNNNVMGSTLTLTDSLGIASGGIMLTANDTNSGHGVLITGGSLTSGNGTDLLLWQANTSNAMTVASAVQGAIGLEKMGAGTLVLANTANTYAGKTCVYGGTLSITAETSLGAPFANPTADALVLSNGALQFQNNMTLSANRGILLGGNSVIDTQANNVTIAGPITNATTGIFGFTKAGSGVLTLAANNAFNGSLTISGGTVTALGNLLMPNGLVTVGNTANTPAMLIFAGGTLTTTTASSGLISGKPAFVAGQGANALGVLTMNSGIATFSNDLDFGYGPTASDPAMTSYGALLMNGGTLVHQTALSFAFGPVSNSAGVGVWQMTGGTVLGTGGTLRLGAISGTLNKLHGFAILQGGTIGEAGNFMMGDSIAGVVNFLGTNASANNFNFGNGAGSEANLVAGTLTGQIGWNASATGSTLNFNGATLAARTGATNLVGATPNLSNAYVWSGGANLVANASNSNVVAPLLTPAANGISISSITQNGTFSGTTATFTVSGGLPSGQATANASVVAVVVNNTISSFVVTNPGYGYTSAPTITVTGAGGTASAVVSLATLQGINESGQSFSGASGFVAPPAVNILPATNGTQSAGGRGAAGYAVLDNTGHVTGIIITNPGVGYTTITNGTNTYYPTFTLLGGGGAGTLSGTLTSLGANAGGGLTQSGSGTITYSASTSNFAGPVNITSGTMIVSGTFNSPGAISVAGNAALRVSGNVTGAITVAPNGTLIVGTNGLIATTASIGAGGSLSAPFLSGTITGAATIAGGGALDMTGGTIGTLTLAGGLTIGSATAATPLNFDVALSSADAIVATTIAINGTNNTPINLNFTTVPSPNQTLTLAGYTGAAPTGLFLSSNSTKIKFDTIQLINTGDGVVSIVINGKNTPNTAYWTGQFGPGWDNTDPGQLNTNFNDTLTTNAMQYAGTNSIVTFAANTTPAPANLATVLDATWSVLGLALNSGVAPVSISNGTVNGAALTIGSDGIVNNAGAGGLTLNASVTLGTSQTWSNLDSASAITVNGVISGGTASTLAIAGQVALNAANTYAGGTILRGGTLAVGNNAALGSTTGTFTMLPGFNGLLQINVASLTVGGLSGGDSSNAIEMDASEPGTLTLSPTSATTFAGILQDGVSPLSLLVNGPGTQTLAGANTYSGPTIVHSGVLNVSGAITEGTLNAITIGNAANVPAVMTINGGTVTGGTSNPSIFTSAAANAVSVLQINSGVLTTGAEIWVATGPASADSSSYGAMIVNGGTVTTGSYLAIGRGQSYSSAGVGLFQMSGGVVNVTANNLEIGSFQGATGMLHGVAVITGGTIGVGATIMVGQANSGIVNLLGGVVTASTTTIANAAGQYGILNLNGGTLASTIAWSAGAGTLNFNGGTLMAPAAGNILPSSSAGAAYVWSNGAVIDSAGQALTITQPLLSPALSGVGTLSLTGGGTGYTAAPTVTLAGGGGTGATAVAVITNGSVSSLILTNPGVGYTSAPAVTLAAPSSTTGTSATASVVNLTTLSGIASIPATGSGYVAPPIVQINPAAGGQGSGATAYATVSPTGQLTGIVITNPGIGYDIVPAVGANPAAYPTVTLIGGGGVYTAGTLSLASLISAPGGLIKNGAGTLTLNGTANTFAGTSAVNGGLLNLSGVITTSPTWNLNGGTLTNTGTLSAAAAVNIGAATLVSSGSFSTGILSVNASGVANLSGSAAASSVTINAGGIINVGGNFTAASNVNVLGGGNLNLAGGAIATPAVSVATGGFLSGSGNIGGAGTAGSVITVAGGPADTGGAINLFNGVADSITINGTLSLGGSPGNPSSLYFELGGGTTDTVSLGANPLLANAGGATVFVNPLGAVAAGQNYRLLSYADGSPPNLTLNSTYMGFDAVALSVNNNSASLAILTAPAAPAVAYFSNHAGTGVWNTVLNGQTSNWNTDAASDIPVSQLPGAATDVYLNTDTPSSVTVNYTLGQNFDIHSLHMTANVNQPATIAGNNILTIEAGGITTDALAAGLTISAPVNLGTSQTWVNNSSSPLAVSGPISSTGSVNLTVTASVAPVVLSGNSSFAGTLTLQQGTLTAGSAGALGNGSASFLFSAGSGAVLDINGNNAVTGDLIGDATSTIRNGGTVSAALVANAVTSATFSGALTDGTSPLGLIKGGAGTLTIDNPNNTFTGSTTVRQGTLILNNSPLTPGANAGVILGDAAGNSRLVINGGSLTAFASANPTLLIGAAAGANSVLTLNSGVINTPQELHIGSNGGYGAFIMNGGAVSVGSGLTMGSQGGSALLDVNGGSLTVAANQLSLGSFTSGSQPQVQIANFNGGTVTTTNSLWIGEDPGTPTSVLYSVVNITGNALVTTGAGPGAGVVLTVNDGGTMGGMTGILNLIGGTLTTQSITSGGSSNRTPILNFNGGNLVAQAGAGQYFILTDGTDYIWGGGANINDGGQAVSIYDSLQAPSGNGVASITVTGATGFISEPVIRIAGGGGTGATAVANIDANGNLTSVTITNPGVGYTSAPSVTLTGGGFGAGNSTAGTLVGSVTLASNAGSGGGLNKFGTGTLTLFTFNTYTGPTNVYQGVLAVYANSNFGDMNVAAPVNLYGTTLQITSSFSMVGFHGNQRNINLINGATLDTVTSANTLTVGGVIAGSGSLTLTGGGGLIVNGTSSVPIFVSNGSRLGGAGIVTAPVTLDSTATAINLQDNKLGTLTLSGGLAILGYSSALRFDLGGASVTGIDAVNLGANTLTLSGGNVNVYLNDLRITPGTYNLMTYASLVSSGAGVTLDFGSQQIGAGTASLTLTPTALVLTITGAPVPATAYWSGSQSTGAWNTVSGGSLTNFDTTAASGINTFQTPGIITDVYFATTNPAQAGAVATTLGAEMAARGVTVTNSQTASVAIAGSTLTLGAGGLNMQASAGVLTVSSAIVLNNDQTWTNANTNAAMIVGGAISGSQNLTLTGNITLNGASSFAGNIFINGGSITMGNSIALGATTNVVNFGPSSHATLNIGPYSPLFGALNGDATATVTSGAANMLSITAAVNASYAGAITGFLGLKVGNISSGTLTLSGVDSYSGATTINLGGTLKIGSSTVFPASTALTDNGTVDLGGFNGSVSSLAGTGTLTNNSTSPSLLTISGTANTTFSGALINGTGGLSMTFSGGTLTLSGTHNYSGTTTVAAGRVIFSGGAAHNIGALSGAGTLAINSNATLTSDGVNLLSGTWIVNGSQVLRSSSGGGAYAMFAAGNGAAALSGTSEISGSNLSFGAGAHLDLRNNALIIEATSGTKAALLAAIAGDVQSGAITSSTAASNTAYGLEVADNAVLGATHFGGMTVDANSIIVTQALLGDANLDGVVNPSDLLIWANNFNNVNQFSVSTGDFNLDGVVNPTDLLIWANNFNNSIGGNGVPSIASGGGPVVGGGRVATPEPASLALLGLGVTGMLIRRKRRQPRASK